MTETEKLAAEIHMELKGVGFSFDPASLIAIITVFIKLFQDCGKTPAQAERIAQSPNFLQRRVLKKVIRQHGKDEDECEDLEAAVTDAGQKMNVNRFKLLFAEHPKAA